VRSDAGSRSSLVGAVRAVVEGSSSLSPDAAHAAIGAAVTKGTLKTPSLGRPEPQVLARRRGAGAPGKSLRDSGISPATGKAYRRNIMRKLGLHSVAELTKFALRQG